MNDFIDFILLKKREKESKLNEVKNNEANKRPFHILKGKIKMADDFDEPLEDFKEYM